MNRYIVQGLAADLRAGKQIGLMGYTREHANAVFRILLEALGTEPSRTIVANGSESVELPNGGRLVVLTKTGNTLHRNAILDVLVALDWSNYPVDTIEAILAELSVSAQTGRHTEIIRN